MKIFQKYFKIVEDIHKYSKYSISKNSKFKLAILSIKWKSN